MAERVVGLGARLLDGPTDWEYGERQATLCDPFGHYWVLTQTLVDKAPEDWAAAGVRSWDAAATKY